AETVRLASNSEASLSVRLVRLLRCEAARAGARDAPTAIPMPLARKLLRLKACAVMSSSCVTEFCDRTLERSCGERQFAQEHRRRACVDSNFHILSQREKESHETVGGERTEFVALQRGDLRPTDFERLGRGHLIELLGVDQPIDLHSESHLDAKRNRV